MKAFYSITFFLASAGLFLLPAAVQAGPDDAPRPRRPVTDASTRPAPPQVTVQRDSSTVTTVEEDRPIQPLRQREESVHYRIAYKLLNEIGFTGTEGDRRPFGYQQLYGPPPMLVYQRPPGPRPRRFPHFPVSETVPEKKEAVVTKKDKPEVEPTPESGPTPTVTGKPVQTESDEEDTGILPGSAGHATKNRNEEMLSYFQRPGVGTLPQNGGPVPNSVPQPDGAGDADYLRAPEQLPIPPSRATYRVVPK